MKKIGLIGLSNPCTNKSQIDQTVDLLKSWGHFVDVSPMIDQKTIGKERAVIFNDWMGKYDYLFDVSGGDLANETIPYLDLEKYKNTKTIFHGYSDLTCVLNVLGQYRPCGLFQIRGNTNLEELKGYLDGTSNSLFIHQGFGGNIRCLLKLAGTPYFPNLENKTLFLESRSGNEYRIRTFFMQLEMMDVFKEVKHVCLGEFTELNDNQILLNIVSSYTSNYTTGLRFGHSIDSKGIWIGE